MERSSLVTIKFIRFYPRLGADLRSQLAGHRAIVMFVLLQLVCQGGLASPIAVQKGAEAAARGSEQEQIQEQAKVLISSVAADSEAISRPFARVRLLAEAADLMWPLDPVAARGYFRHSAEIALSETGMDADAERKASTLYLTEKLRTRDQEMFEWFMEQLEQRAKDQPKASARSPRRDIEGSSGVRGRVLLDIARQKLEAGKLNEAAELLGESFVDGVMDVQQSYLRGLAAKAPQLAILAFSRGLDLIRALPTHELGDTLRMAEFLFNMPGISIGGRAMSLFDKPSISNPPPELVRKFLAFARDVILENSALVRADELAAQRGDTAIRRRPQIVYLAIEQLLPIFETHWPEPVAQLREAGASMLAMLRAQGIPPAKVPSFKAADGDNEQQPSDEDIIRQELDRAEKAPTQSERDDWYYSATIHLILDDRPSEARNAAKGVADSARKRQVLTLVDLAQIRKAWNSKDVTEAYRITEQMEDPNLKVQALIWLGQQAKRTGDIARARELLSSAAIQARKVELSLSRFRAYVMISQAMFMAGETQGFESMQSAITELNTTQSPKLSDLSGKGGAFGIPRVTRFGPSSMIQEAVSQSEAFDYFATLTDLAVRDSYGALSLADSMTNVLLKLHARLAVARGQISQKARSTQE